MNEQLRSEGELKVDERKGEKDAKERIKRIKELEAEIAKRKEQKEKRKEKDKGNGETERIKGLELENQNEMQKLAEMQVLKKRINQKEEAGFFSPNLVTSIPNDNNILNTCYGENINYFKRNHEKIKNNNINNNISNNKNNNNNNNDNMDIDEDDINEDKMEIVNGREEYTLNSFASAEKDFLLNLFAPENNNFCLTEIFVEEKDLLIKYAYHLCIYIPNKSSIKKIKIIFSDNDICKKLTEICGIVNSSVDFLSSFNSLIQFFIPILEYFFQYENNQNIIDYVIKYLVSPIYKEEKSLFLYFLFVNLPKSTKLLCKISLLILSTEYSKYLDAYRKILFNIFESFSYPLLFNVTDRKNISISKPSNLSLLSIVRYNNNNNNNHENINDDKYQIIKNFYEFYDLLFIGGYFVQQNASLLFYTNFLQLFTDENVNFFIENLQIYLRYDTDIRRSKPDQITLQIFQLGIKYFTKFLGYILRIHYSAAFQARGEDQKKKIDDGKGRLSDIIVHQSAIRSIATNLKFISIIQIFLDYQFDEDEITKGFFLSLFQHYCKIINFYKEETDVKYQTLFQKHIFLKLEEKYFKKKFTTAYEENFLIFLIRFLVKYNHNQHKLLDYNSFSIDHDIVDEQLNSTSQSSVSKARDKSEDILPKIQQMKIIPKNNKPAKDLFNIPTSRDNPRHAPKPVFKIVENASKQNEEKGAVQKFILNVKRDICKFVSL